ncbi:MAG: transporter substrate-binding domain-containing protein [Treponema sp.]|nr:transporter substrate-binding domain-containing protein [Treponema sp.]
MNKNVLTRLTVAGFFAFCLLSVLLFPGCKREKAPLSFSVMQKYSTDSAFIQDKRTLIVGVTDYAPLDWQQDGAWVGFDAELASQFARSLNVEIIFREIDWDEKTKLLTEGSIDCIWNGMSRTDELLKTITCSRPYLVNQQVIVLPSEKVARYKHESECSHLLFAVETGSTGADVLKSFNFRTIGAQTQKQALQMIVDGKADAAVVDSIMASSLADFDGKLSLALSLNYEQLCVGLRKGSDLLEPLNSFLRSAEVDGVIGSLKAKYGIE